MRSFIVTLLAVALPALAACASTSVETKAGDPAHPETETAALPSVGASLAAHFDPFAELEGNAPAGHEASGEPAAASAHDGHDHSAPQADAAPAQGGVVYTCPMHPEVVKDGPGKCPKCGMNLVPKEPKEKGPKTP